LDQTDFGEVGTSGIQFTKWWYLICDLRSVDNKFGTWCMAARE
jgi:hypothetical protein